MVSNLSGSFIYGFSGVPCHSTHHKPWAVSVLQRTFHSWTIEDACDFLAMLPDQPLAAGVDASRTMTFRRDKDSKEVL